MFVSGRPEFKSSTSDVGDSRRISKRSVTQNPCLVYKILRIPVSSHRDGSTHRMLIENPPKLQTTGSTLTKFTNSILLADYSIRLWGLKRQLCLHHRTKASKRGFRNTSRFKEKPKIPRIRSCHVKSTHSTPSTQSMQSSSLFQPNEIVQHAQSNPPKQNRAS